jgi:hypothetical protein
MKSYAIALGAAALTACVSDYRSNPVAPPLSSGSAAPITISASSSGPATPPFNDEIILRDVTGLGGFGHVKFRQPQDEDRIVYLDTWVRDLQPNTNYQLQRATDANVNDDCTGTNWLTLGIGTIPQSITTDWRGTGRADLSRNLSTTPIGSTFDIHFRVIEQASHSVVLESDCYQFVVRQ